MPPKDKGKAKASPSSPKKRKRPEERRTSPDSPSKRARQVQISEKPALTRALPLVSPFYILAERLHKVSKLTSDDSFYSRFEEDDFKKLGEGSYGKVSQFTDRKTGNIYAVKIVEKLTIGSDKFPLFVEAACFTRIIPGHKNVIHLSHICESPGKIYYVMECLSKFDLRDTFRALTPVETRTCFYRLLQAVDHLHQYGIVHGDIKLDNICTREGEKANPIVIDFGLCSYNQKMVQKKRKTFVDTDVFTSREIDRMLSRTAYTDLLRLADVLEMLLTGKSRLLDDNSNADLYPLKPGTDPEALALLEFMRDRQKLKTTTCEQLLQHNWFEPED